MEKFRLLGLLLLSSTSFAGLVIHTTEIGVGKFHRYDNQVHAYPATSAWAPYVLQKNADISKTVIQNNKDGSVTVFFSTLDDLMSSVISVSNERHEKVSVLNIHGHGLPGRMWFPTDANEAQDWTCADWQTAAAGSDQDNYDQYYSPVSADEIDQIRQISNNPSIEEGCTTGLAEWKAGVAKLPKFKSVLDADAQIHFLSCVVGLGSVGQAFTQGMAELLLPNGSKGRVESSMNFGLGDWSMPEGMGFWDMQTEAQLDHDNAIYPVDKKDRELKQKGTIRMVTYGSSSRWTSTLLANRDFLKLGYETSVEGTPVEEPAHEFSFSPAPMSVRIPGTAAYAIVK